MMFDWPHPIEAVLFDMDGTLLDSEPLTEFAVNTLLHKYGVGTFIDCSQFHGVTWTSIARTLVDRFPSLENVSVAEELSTVFYRALQTEQPPSILGAVCAVRSASTRVNIAVVSSSRRNSIQLVVGRMGLVDSVHHIVGAEDVQFSKPNPECFQMAANYFEVSYERCLVFEDSMAGLQAAHTAGMATIAIGPSPEKEALSTMMISTYEDLPDGFFDYVCHSNGFGQTQL